MNNRPAVDPAAILFKGVGTWSAIAVAVAGMAPTMAMNLNPQEPAEHVGRVVPLVFALSTLVVLLVAWCFARLAHEHPNAGSAYGFVAAILGPRAGLIAGWTLFGTYLCFAAVGLAAVGLFGANLLQRLDLWRDASSIVLTVLAAVVVAPLSIVPARRAGLVLIVLEGIAVAAMVLMAGAVLLLVAQGHGPQGDPPLRDLFVPTSGVGAAAIALGLSFGLLSFAGFEQVATLGEEVEEVQVHHPSRPDRHRPGGRRRVHAGDRGRDAGLRHRSRPASPDSPRRRRCWRISRRAISAAGRATCSTVSPSAPLWAARWRRSWRRRAFCLRCAGTCFRRARWRASRKPAARPATPPSVSCVAAIVGYLILRIVFRASGSDAFFWGSTLGALALLVAYLLVVVSAAGALLRPSGGTRWLLFIPALAAVAIAYTLWVNVYPPQPGAYRVIPWLVLAWCCAPVIATLLHPRLLELVASGCLATRDRMKQD